LKTKGAFGDTRDRFVQISIFGHDDRILAT